MSNVLDPIPEDEKGLGISWTGVFIGLAVGIGLGLLYAWVIDPVVIRNVSPADLRSEDQRLYVAAIAQEYGDSGNLQLAINRLLDVDPDSDPFQLAADTTCELIRSGQINDVSSISVIRNLRSLYEPQGIVADCDTQIANTPVPVAIVSAEPSITPTVTLTPVASKTPTVPIPPQANNTPLPTNPVPEADGATFREAGLESFCSADFSGTIEVYVRDTNGIELPGVAVEVLWNNGQERQVFYTGLKPVRGQGYADFTMTPNQSYRVNVLDEGQPSRELEAVPCDDTGTIISYRVVIQRFFNQ